jgi:hypothetical protein
LPDCDKAIFIIDGVKRLDEGVKIAIKRLNKIRIEESLKKKMNLLAD